MLHYTTLKEDAIEIADALSEMEFSFQNRDNSLYGHQGHGYGNGQGNRGFNAFLKAIYALYDFLILLPDGEYISPPCSHCEELSLSDFSKTMEAPIEKAFLGETVISENRMQIQSLPTLTACTPIFDENQTIVAVLILHSPIDGIYDAAGNGYQILFFSLLLTVILSFLLALFLTKKFTKPLEQISVAALNLAEGNYNCKLEIQEPNSQDEISRLSFHFNLLAQRLYDADKESSRLEKLRRDFISNISHELKTPVTVLRGSLEAICDEVVTDPLQIQEYHRQMLKESIFLQRLIGDLLDLSKLQNLDFAMETSDVFIEDVLDDAVRSISVIAQQRQVSIKVNCLQPDLCVIGDYGRLRQLLLILLSNAVKFSPSHQTVVVSLENNKLSVCDCGSGIAKEELDFLFDRFYKSRDEQNKDGSGLGLTIAKEIVQRHNFKIFVENRNPSGACFTILFSKQN